MISVDTNILVYAHREEFSEHRDARRRLMQLADGNDLWAIPVFCVAEFLRVVTHPSVLKPPTALEDALRSLEALLSSDSLRLLVPGPRFSRLLVETVRESGVTGNLVFDAQIVAVCREHGVRRLLTQDRDFLRFDSIEVHLLIE